MPGDGPRLRVPFQSVRDHLQAWHVAAGPADTGDGPEREPAPEAVRHDGEAEMCGSRQGCAEQINAARRNTVGQRHQDRDGDDIGGEIGADEPAGFGCRKRPARHKAWQERRQGEGADLRSTWAVTTAPTKREAIISGSSWASEYCSYGDR